jgi:hypothetical protein
VLAASPRVQIQMNEINVLIALAVIFIDIDYRERVRED